jgi:branched-chain amino acid transport system ATP-binding protein
VSTGGGLLAGPHGSVDAAGGSGAGLAVDGVRAAYGRIEVLHGVDLHVPGGSVFALLGPNGAGKSTLLKVVNGRLRPTVGAVAIDDVPASPWTPEALARAGVIAIPEGRGVFPNLTVRDNLRMWTYRGGISAAEVETRAYEQFPRLKERRKQLAGTLSGGEQQMLAISRALAGETRVLLLDEISMGLAPIIVGHLYELVAAIAAGGVTVVVVEQFAETALGVADRAAIMLHGRIAHEGTPEEMAAAAEHAYL